MVDKYNINEVIDNLTEKQTKFVIKALLASGRIHEPTVKSSIELAVTIVREE